MENVQRPYKGLHMDNSPQDQPKDTYRFALNAITESENSDMGFVSNEESNTLVQNLGSDYRIIGSVYMTDKTALFITNNETSIIATIDQSDNYEVIVDDSTSEFKLDFHMSNPVYATYRLRQGCEDTVYFVDGNRNRPRYFNFASPEDFQTNSLWDARKFILQKSTGVYPEFSNFQVNESGNLAPGSYSFAIQLLDSDLNPTEYLSSSDSIIIYHDSYSRTYYNITGSLTSAGDNPIYGKTNKSITFNVSNLDTVYDFYRIAIIKTTSGTGEITEVTTTNPIPISQTTFTYTGNEDANVSTIEEVQQLNTIIQHAHHVEQLENRLILGNTLGKQYNPCNLQKFASRIKANYTTKEVRVDGIDDISNPKRATKHVEDVGYMPGEIYSFGIVYVFEDGTRSPVYHIPGKNSSENTNMSDDNTSSTDVYSSLCSDYWGTDSTGAVLLDTPVRHHRFPTRCETGHPMQWVEEVTADRTVYSLNISVGSGTNTDQFADRQTFQWRVNYTIDGEAAVAPFSAINTGFNSGFPSTGQLFNGAGFITSEQVLVFTSIEEYDPTNNTWNAINTIYPDFVYTSGVTNSTVTEVVGKETYTQIFGICFSDVEVPPPSETGDCKIVGYEIVRNERTDDNKTILDSGVFMPITLSKANRRFLSHAQLAPDFGHDTPDAQPFGLCAERANYAVALVNPEYKFREKEWTNVTYFQEGIFEVNSINRTAKIFQDISPGSSYDPEIHRRSEEDEDGFDFRNTGKVIDVTYRPICEEEDFPSNKTYYLESLEEIEIEDPSQEIKRLLNISSDNKIAIVVFDEALDADNLFTATEATENRIYPYVKMKRDLANPYSNFRNLPYYKEHDGVIYFDTEEKVTSCNYNGDVYTSPMRYTNSFFYDVKIAGRDVKRSFWHIVAGSILIAAAIVLAPFSGGTSLISLPAIVGGLTAATIAGTALYYGIQQVATGISKERFRKVYEEDYENGLRESACDSWTHYIFERDTTLGVLNGPGDNPDDDEIRWHIDLIKDFWMESNVNMSWRSRLGTITDGFEPPRESDIEPNVQSILFDKLTITDTDSLGPTYQNYAKAELYLDNPDYYRRNDGKVFFHLPIQYDCCSTCFEQNPHRIVYSQQSFQEELTDNYRTFLPNNYRDIEGETGEITNLIRYGDRLHVHTEEALWVLPHNYQERVTNELVTFIGTGEFFITPPKKIIDDDSGMSAGTTYKQGTVKTPQGYFFVADKESKIYQYNGKSLMPISDVGMSNYFRQNIKNGFREFHHAQTGFDYDFQQNPLGRFGHGFLMTYDSEHERIILTKRDFEISDTLSNSLLSSDGINIFIFTNYEQTIEDCERDGYTYLGVQDNRMVFDSEQIVNGQATRVLKYVDPDPFSPTFTDAAWTISYSLQNKSWTSFHSYMPEAYFHVPLGLYSVDWSSNSVYRHNEAYNYQTFYDILRPHIIEYVSLSNPLQTRYWEDIRINSEARSYDSENECELDERNITYNKAILYNSRQITGEMELVVRDEETGDFFENSAKDLPGFQVKIDRHERDWSLNDIRDYRTDYSATMFKKDKSSLQSSYYIDKIVNTSAVSSSKDFTQLELLRDKYLVIRLIFDNFGDKKLILNYSVENEKPSMR